MIDPNIFGHIANGLFGAAYVFKDILWLRILSVVACVASIAFHYYAPATPLWVSIYWDVFFILVNLVHIAIMIRERMYVQFSDAERKIYNAVFHILPPRDFRKFLKIAEWREVKQGETIISNGSKVDTLYVVHDGRVHVASADQDEPKGLSEGDFLGEFAFISGGVATGTVQAASDAQLLSWRFDRLRRLLAKNPSMEASFQGVLGANLVRKILSGKE